MKFRLIAVVAVWLALAGVASAGVARTSYKGVKKAAHVAKVAAKVVYKVAY